MITNSEEYREKLRREHEKHGAFRSGEGTAEEIMQRRREMEEKRHLKSLYQNKKFALDTKTNEKLYQLYLEDFKQRAIRNDKVDLVPRYTFNVETPSPL